MLLQQAQEDINSFVSFFSDEFLPRYFRLEASLPASMCTGALQDTVIYHIYDCLFSIYCMAHEEEDRIVSEKITTLLKRSHDEQLYVIGVDKKIWDKIQNYVPTAESCVSPSGDQKETLGEDVENFDSNTEETIFGLANSYKTSHPMGFMAFSEMKENVKLSNPLSSMMNTTLIPDDQLQGSTKAISDLPGERMNPNETFFDDRPLVSQSLSQSSLTEESCGVKTISPSIQNLLDPSERARVTELETFHEPNDLPENMKVLPDSSSRTLVNERKDVKTIGKTFSRHTSFLDVTLSGFTTSHPSDRNTRFRNLLGGSRLRVGAAPKPQSCASNSMNGLDIGEDLLPTTKTEIEDAVSSWMEGSEDSSTSSKKRTPIHDDEISSQGNGDLEKIAAFAQFRETLRVGKGEASFTSLQTFPVFGKMSPSRRRSPNSNGDSRLSSQTAFDSLPHDTTSGKLRRKTQGMIQAKDVEERVEEKEEGSQDSISSDLEQQPESKVTEILSPSGKAVAREENPPSMMPNVLTSRFIQDLMMLYRCLSVSGATSYLEIASSRDRMGISSLEWERMLLRNWGSADSLRKIIPPWTPSIEKTFSDLDGLIEEEMESSLGACVIILSLFGILRSPTHKILSLVHVAREIQETLNKAGRGVFGADDMLPLFIYVLIRCHPSHLISSLHFVEDWASPDNKYGINGYLFAQMEVASRWVLGAMDVTLSVSPLSSSPVSSVLTNLSQNDTPDFCQSPTEKNDVSLSPSSQQTCDFPSPS